MDGLNAVQSRIAAIQSQIAAFAPQQPVTSSASWASAAAAAGLNPTTAATSLIPATSSGASASEDAVIAAAKNYLGVPYVWGGTDPAKGLDCSGFTQRVFADIGIDLPRVSSAQATAGRPVASLDQARPGDLVFFDYSSSRPGIDHVGIYLGDGKMIAAPQTGDVVRVQDVGSPTVIRRVLPEKPTSATALSVGGTTGSLGGLPFADLFAASGAKHGVPAALLAAVAKTESGFNPAAVSPAGARGLMQFMPQTAAGLGVNPADPASSIDGAARYLAENLRRFGSTDLALAAYNAGPGAVRRSGGIPPYAETQNYVKKVNSAWESYR